MKKNLDFYIKRIPKFLNKNICNKTIKEIKKLEWKQHTFYNVNTNKSQGMSGEQELDVSTNISNEGIDSKIIMGKLWLAIDSYIKDYKFNWFNSWQGYSRVRFNRYSKTKKMAEHCDHIHSMFDGQIKGVPILSIVGVLNDNYEGGEFIMFKNKKIELLAGDLLIFPSNFLYPHKVDPVKKGTRYSYVSWVY
tara:strand:+ start:800 stop:1375 length:576 start_codon:yes stop_codon:yes gene_type:complete